MNIRDAFITWGSMPGPVLQNKFVKDLEALMPQEGANEYIKQLRAPPNCDAIDISSTVNVITGYYDSTDVSNPFIHLIPKSPDQLADYIEALVESGKMNGVTLDVLSTALPTLISIFAFHLLLYQVVHEPPDSQQSLRISKDMSHDTVISPLHPLVAKFFSCLNAAIVTS